MIKHLKQMLLERPEAICNILEQFDFHNIIMGSHEIRAGRSSESKKNAISIRIRDNDWLTVKDFSKAVSLDLFSYISQEKGVELKDVFAAVKKELGIDNYYDLDRETKRTVFGGFFNRIGKNRKYEQKVISEEILDEYEKVPVQRFLRDGISIKTQKKFGIGYDKESQRITIPLRDQFGELVGVKGRLNYEDDEQPKYLFLHKCMMSQLLYGYYENYSYMYGGDVIICESEKSPMQADSMGHHNVVGIGGSSISAFQAKLIIGMMPKRIILCMDEGVNMEVIRKNLDTLYTFSKMFDIEIGWWNSDYDIDIPEKASATDLGKAKFEEILNEQIVWEN